MLDFDRHRLRAGACCAGFTLIELLVGTTILALILVMLFSMNSQIATIWKRSSAEIDAFQDARAAYQTLTMRLSQATLNTYLDYYDQNMEPRAQTNSNSGDSFVPRYYARNSDLHFVIDHASALVPANVQSHPGHAVFFQAPLGFTLNPSNYSGLPAALNACGYYVEFNSDQNINQSGLPSFLDGLPAVQARWRFRLMEFLQPTESLSVFSLPSSGSSSEYNRWFSDFLPAAEIYPAITPLRTLHALAENIIVLAVLPMDPGASLPGTYAYDSRGGTIFTPTHHQLPSLLRVVMIAIDEPSAQRFTAPGDKEAPSAIIEALSGRFQTPAHLDADIAAVMAKLIEAKVNYRVFDTSVGIRGGKWSVQ